MSGTRFGPKTFNKVQRQRAKAKGMTGQIMFSTEYVRCHANTQLTLFTMQPVLLRFDQRRAFQPDLRRKNSLEYSKIPSQIKDVQKGGGQDTMKGYEAVLMLVDFVEENDEE